MNRADLTRNARKLWRKLKSLWHPPLHRVDRRLDYKVYGSDYGGWPVLDGSLSAQSCVFSFGVGEDISFDLAVIGAFGCQIEAFDPTPRCGRWIKTQALPSQFRFHPIGLSDRTETLHFTAPSNPDHVLFTASASQDGRETIALPVKALSEIVTSMGGMNIDLLKMDIEGSEYAAIPDILARGPKPRQLCVEFHHGMHGHGDHETREAVDMLRAAGYALFYVSDTGREYGFVLADQNRH